MVHSHDIRLQIFCMTTSLHKGHQYVCLGVVFMHAVDDDKDAVLGCIDKLCDVLVLSAVDIPAVVCIVFSDVSSALHHTPAMECLLCPKCCARQQAALANSLPRPGFACFMLEPPSKSVYDNAFTSAGTDLATETSIDSLGVQPASKGILAADVDQICMSESQTGQLHHNHPL